MRCFAVIAVVLFHWHLFKAGWIGVEIFFVLSGYLITQILVHDRGRFDRGEFLLRFYWRRCLRIFPLYFAYLIALGVAYLVAGVPESLPRVLGSLSTYTLNFRLAFSNDLPGTSSYSHLWTLAIEEQFYLVWPFLVYSLSPTALRRCLSAIVCTVPMLRLFTAWLAQHATGDADFAIRAVYLLTTSHLDAFALGACVATGFPIFKANTGWTLSLATGLLVAAGVIVVLAAPTMAWVRDGLGYPIWLPLLYQYVWGYSVLNFFAAALIAFLAAPSIFGKIFELSPFVFIGRISYGVYVVHKAIQFIAWSIWQPPAGSAADYLLLCLTTLIAVALAAASYRWFESPFLRMKNSAPFGRRNLASNA